MSRIPGGFGIFRSLEDPEVINLKVAHMGEHEPATLISGRLSAALSSHDGC